MHETPVHTESLDGPAPQYSKALRHLRAGVIHEIQVFIHNIHHRRPYRHAFKQRLTAGIQDRIVGTDDSFDKLLHHIGSLRQIVEEDLEVAVIFQLPCVGRAHADVGLDDHGIADAVNKRASGLLGGDNALPCGGDLRLQVELLHQGLFLDEADPVGLNACCHIEIRAQTGVLLQPVFIHGFDPVDPSIFKGKEGHSTIDLVVFLQAAHAVILRQRGLERGLQTVIGRIADAKNPDAVSVQAFTELPVCMGKIGRDKDKVHGSFLLF